MEREEKRFQKRRETRTVVVLVPELESNAVNLRKSLQNILIKIEIET
jgi:hypothetical protein